MSVCVMAGTFHLLLTTGAFTLAWTHSIEKIRWEEDYRLEAGMLVLEAARIRGSGAGMEPPADARRRDGVWHYRPDLRLPRLVLANSPFGGRYEICTAARCESLPPVRGGSQQPTIIEPCEAVR